MLLKIEKGIKLGRLPALLVFPRLGLVVGKSARARGEFSVVYLLWLCLLWLCQLWPLW